MAWTKTDADRIAKQIQKLIDGIVKINEKNEKTKHSFKGQALAHHREALSAERGLWGIKGTFERIASSKTRRQR